MPPHRRIAVFAAIGIAIACYCVPPVHADTVPQGTAQAVVTLDPALTRIDFTLPGSLHTTKGTFRMRSGSISIDPKTGSASGKVVVDAASGDSGDVVRDARMKGTVLEVARYPEIIFVPQQTTGQIDPDGAFHAVLAGTMYIHGETRQVSMNTRGRIEGDHVSATADFSIPYVEWGLEDPSVLFLRAAKSVDLEVTAAGDVTWIAAVPGP